MVKMRSPAICRPLGEGGHLVQVSLVDMEHAALDDLLRGLHSKLDLLAVKGRTEKLRGS